MKTEKERIAYNCKKATFLIEKAQGGLLSAKEKKDLSFHLKGCFICRIYQHQSLLISAAMRNFFVAGTSPEIKLSDEFKQALAAQIQAKATR